jgi:hypothetical protein
MQAYDMKLNDDQWQLFQDKIVVKKCPLCGGGLDYGRNVLEITDTGVRPGITRPIETRLTATCMGCGYIMEFNGRAFGIASNPR